MTRLRHFSAASGLILIAILFGGCHATTPASPTDANAKRPAPAIGENPRPGSPPQHAYETFDVVWETIEETHFDPEHNGVDWSAARLEYRPQIEDTRSMGEVRQVIEMMIRELGQSHFVIIPGGIEEIEIEKMAVGDNAGDETNPPSIDRPDGAPGNNGMRLDWVEGAPTVAFIRPQSPADLQGVRPGWKVAQVDGGDPNARLTSIRAAAEASGASIADFEAYMMLNGIARGQVGNTRQFTFIVEDESTTELEIGFEVEPGIPVKFGHLPPMTTRCESRVLSRDELETLGASFTPGQATPRIVLLTFNVWMFPIMVPIAAAVDADRDADGFIIDLRENPGGVGGLSMGIAGQFLDERLSLGDMITRDTTMHFSVNPQRATPDGRIVKPFAGPLAILIDQGSASTSEIFAAGLQQLGRAKVIGRNSAGAALPATLIKLPNGDTFMYAMANFIGPEGTSIEGGGVKPDIDVTLTRTTLLETGDPDLSVAVEWILTEDSSGS